MADGMMIPPWIQPADTAKNYLSGLQIGVNIAQQTQRLQAQREASAIESEMKIRQLEEQSAERRQRIEMDKAYHDQLVGLRQQQLEEAAQKNALATKMAAGRFAAQQQYRTRVAGGEDPSKVMLELGPTMGAGAGDIGAALRATRVREKPTWIPADPATGAPGHFETPAGAVHIPPVIRPESDSRLVAAQVSELKARRKDLAAGLPLRTGKPEDATKRAAGEQQIADITRRIDSLLRLGPAARQSSLTNAAPTGGVRTVQRNPKTGRFEVAKPVPESELKSHSDYDEEDRE